MIVVRSSTFFSIIEVEWLVVVTCQWDQGHLPALVALLSVKHVSLLRRLRGVMCVVGGSILFYIGGWLCCGDEMLHTGLAHSIN